MPVFDPVISTGGRDDAITFVAQRGGVLAILTGVEGGYYRPLGAMMAVRVDGAVCGSLSGGCVDAAIAEQAREVMRTGASKQLRYGEGSPFVDARLPCGAGIDIALIPVPDGAIFNDALGMIDRRAPFCLSVHPDTADLECTSDGPTHWVGDIFHIRCVPQCRHVVFGTGAEVLYYAKLATAAGQGCAVGSPDEGLLNQIPDECTRFVVSAPELPTDIVLDPFTAVILFFHDHEWEPVLLEAASTSDAFYIGAQGSRRTRAARDEQLTARGMSREAIAKIHGPIGLIPATRDPSALAVSVLAEVTAAYGQCVR